jgi:L-lactate dehydrogenase (cytochrome)
MGSAPRGLGPAGVINVEDLRSLARRRLPRVVFDYLDGGAEDEETLRENRLAFGEIHFRPRLAESASAVDVGTRVLGFPVSIPALLAPVGYSRLMNPGGEVAASRAAGDAGTIYILSTISGYPLEEVKAASRGPVWFQLYVLRGRETAEATLERARAAGFSALVVTIDTPVAGMRERDFRNGMRELLGGSWVAKAPFLPQFLARPAWLYRFLRDGGVRPLPNVVAPGEGPMPLMDVGAALARTAITWEDLRWIRDAWRGPLVLKGVMTGEDARRAADSGVAALVVSNHGGRQLDGAPASLRILPEIVSAVKGRCEVLMDGGVRRGADIVKALCLGARAVLVGRAYAYGLSAAGEAGVVRALEILRADLERTLKLVGCASVGGLDPSYVQPARAPRGGVDAGGPG